MTGEQLNKTLTEARPSIWDIFRLQEESDIENHPAKNWNPKEEVERLAKWQNVDKYFKYCDDKQLSFVFAKKAQTFCTTQSFIYYHSFGKFTGNLRDVLYVRVKLECYSFILPCAQYSVSGAHRIKDLRRRHHLTFSQQNFHFFFSL